MDRLATFDQHRPLLFAIAYRMLGSAMDAEDILQEAYLRWQAAANEAHTPKAYLTSIVTRLCIDQLRSAREKRETYIGPWLPEPIMTEPAPDTTLLAESLSIAFLVMLESLSPLERAVFLLRDAFDYDYDEIAAIVGKNPANCRQMVKRARDHLAQGRPRYNVQPGEQERLLFQFGQACAAGDMDGLLAMLADDIVAASDGGGKVAAARNLIVGPERVARFILGVMGKMPDGAVVGMGIVNGQPAVVTFVGEAPYGVMAFDLAGGRIRRIFNILNPEKLRRMALQP